MNDQDKRILRGLIESCMTVNPSIFIPYLLEKSVCTNMPNKMRFYRFYEHMVNCVHCKCKSNSNDKKKLFYKFGRIDWKGRNISLLIYDNIHNYPRLTFILNKKNGKLCIETLPF